MAKKKKLPGADYTDHPAHLAGVPTIKWGDKNEAAKNRVMVTGYVHTDPSRYAFFSGVQGTARFVIRIGGRPQFAPKNWRTPPRLKDFVSKAVAYVPVNVKRADFPWIDKLQFEDIIGVEGHIHTQLKWGGVIHADNMGIVSRKAKPIDYVQLVGTVMDQPRTIPHGSFEFIGKFNLALTSKIDPGLKRVQINVSVVRDGAEVMRLQPGETVMVKGRLAGEVNEGVSVWGQSVLRPVYAENGLVLAWGDIRSESARDLDY
jgi:hypothetical protein